MDQDKRGYKLTHGPKHHKDKSATAGGISRKSL